MINAYKKDAYACIETFAHLEDQIEVKVSYT